MYHWQVINLGPNWTDFVKITTIKALALVEHNPTHRFFLHFREVRRNKLPLCFEFFFRKGSFHFCFDDIEQLSTFCFVG